jgi:SecY interacting protein Syd
VLKGLCALAEGMKILSLLLKHGQYFDHLIQFYHEHYQTPPEGCKLDGVDESFYVGETEDPDWIYWLPKEKTVVHDFGRIEENLGLRFHRTIHDYFNSYWFLEIVGTYNNTPVQLIGVLPGIELEPILNQLPPGVNTPEFDREKYTNLPLRYWTFGIETSQGLSVVVEVESGNVFLWDWDVEEGTFLSKNLKELIAGLEINWVSKW